MSRKSVLDVLHRFRGSSIAADDAADAIIEQCAVAAEAQDRTGREWVKDSLWDAVMKRAGQNVRALKRGN
jgi:hypothetical protein